MAMNRRADTCRHSAGWAHGNGESRCNDCGTRRFTDYGAVRLRERPEPVRPANPEKADRAAALWIAKTCWWRYRSAWGTSERDRWPAYGRAA
ncbi:DUF6255 family natural product biosynthesis protein [Streptomyces sp. NPDC049577]|uniref:DUF6255 family natural product biosynthesis protein n=1 Tax=Streptomyces sp. NPDC049577 TaxID=3155153 RepID=UPI003421FA58